MIRLTATLEDPRAVMLRDTQRNPKVMIQMTTHLGTQRDQNLIKTMIQVMIVIRSHVMSKTNLLVDAEVQTKTLTRNLRENHTEDTIKRNARLDVTAVVAKAI
ncbi:hypothetical protein Zmor_015091 [Zophobas morio]|uniref:Uncharacterized protein n=1 Tax=Zophobas morio TaxID=2755281 RepID=A0AA38IJ94_9CUCU|nr:hypothetical protein Zmor_015091 [Zophobas morio]